jgi:hypothetical protein
VETQARQWAKRGPGFRLRELEIVADLEQTGTEYIDQVFLCKDGSSRLLDAMWRVWTYFKHLILSRPARISTVPAHP